MIILLSSQSQDGLPFELFYAEFEHFAKDPNNPKIKANDAGFRLFI